LEENIMKSNALRINEKDNIVIATQPIQKGTSVVVDGRKLFPAAEDIPLGHKIALVSLAKGRKILRYGEPIVQATRPIKKGEWVHVHNTRPILGDLKE
jgi:altronate hydrolase